MNEYATLSRILNELKEVVHRENSRHQMDCHLTGSMLSLLEDDIIPQLENELNWEPSDDDLIGEPPMSAAELHSAAHKQHLAMHS